MKTIVVTGAAGAVGRRVLEQMPAGVQVHAIDRRPLPRDDATQALNGDLAFHRADLVEAEVVGGLASSIGRCDTIIHLAVEPIAATDEDDDIRARSLALLDRALDLGNRLGCTHLVLLSSAVVYGAHADNDVPLSESSPIRPSESFAYAAAKAELEQRAERWRAQTPGAIVSVLRPTATLSEGDSSWIGAAIRAAAAVRPEGVDPPIQFLHHDDLASAVALAGVEQLDGVFNVAPDGWLGAHLFRALRGEAQVRLPEAMARWRNEMAKLVAGRSMLEDLEPYVTYPWVVANDRLRASGWEPTYTNAEAYVAGTPPPLLASVRPQRRQELALGLSAAVCAAGVGAMAVAARRFSGGRG